MIVFIFFHGFSLSVCFGLSLFDCPAMEGNSSLDLTHLTEEEQSAILQVLQRDLDLQLVDEGRVRSEVTADAVLKHLCDLWSVSEFDEPTAV